MVNQQKSYLYLSTSVLFWSTVATAFKLALKEYDFIQVLFLASLSSLICLMVALLVEGKFALLLQTTKKDLCHSALLGLLNPTLYYLVLFKAYSLLPAQEAQPLNWTWPIVLSLLAVVFLKQKLRLKNYLALFVSFLGVLTISTKGHFQTAMMSDFFGDFLAISSSALWGTFWIINLKDNRDAKVKLCLCFAFGSFYNLIILLLYSQFPEWNLTGILSSIYIGIFEMGITFLFWFKGLKYAKNSAQAGLIAYFSPFFSLIFIHFVLREAILLSSICGLALIIAGVLIQNLWER